MIRLPLKLIAFVFCFLVVSPQVHACQGPNLEDTLFFDANDRPLYDDNLGQNPSDAKGLVELPPDADVIAEVVLTGANTAQFIEPTVANIVRIVRTSDARVRQGEEIPIRFVFTSCGPNHRNGDKGTIAARIGTDIEDRLVLCLYSRRFSDGRINSPIGSEYINGCNPSEIEAAKRIKQAAESGDVKAQIALGSMYENGRNVSRNNTEAMKWLHLAANSGDAEALYVLGARYWRDENVKEAVKWFKLAAEKGNERAKAALKSQQEAESIENAAKKGEPEAQYKLGQKYDRQTNFIEAAKWYKLAAVQGHVKAANLLGKIYGSGGGGVNIDHVEAIRWYRLAAEQGDAEGQSGLGGQYEFLDKYDESLKWYELAADQGDTEAMERIGTLYRYGRGVGQDDAEAVRWYRLALEQGYTYVLSSLVDVYLRGRVDVEDKTEAEKWFRLSAEEGYNVAQLRLGRMYQMGENVEQNDAEAIKWYLLAAGQRNHDAKDALAALDRQGRGLAANYAEVEKLLRLAAEKRIWPAKTVLESLQN
jgi:TPR repeat protein